MEAKDEEDVSFGAAATGEEEGPASEGEGEIRAGKLASAFGTSVTVVVVVELAAIVALFFAATQLLEPDEEYLRFMPAKRLRSPRLNNSCVQRPLSGPQ